MGPFRQTSVVIAGTVLAAGLTSLNQLLNGELSMKPIIGGFVVGTFLLVIAFFNTAIAAALALLLLISSILINGVPVMQKVMNATS